MDKIQKRTLYYYEFKLGHSVSTAVQNINKAFGKGTASRRTVQRWYSEFKRNQKNLYDKPRSGRPAELNNEDLRAAVEEDPRQTLEELSTPFGVSDTTVSKHIQEIGKVKKLDVWVTRH